MPVKTTKARPETTKARADESRKRRERRRLQLIKDALVGLLRRQPTPIELVSIKRAAVLTVLAQDAAARRLSGDEDVSLEDVVRTSNAADRSVARLGLGKHPKPDGPSLADYLEQRRARNTAEAT